METLKKPAVAFVRLAEGIVMPNTLEVPLPVRFVFILLTPKPSPNMDYHEVGRSFSTLMSNPAFHTVCYKVEERRELLSAINDFLDDSVVLPPGDWDSKNLLSLGEIQELRKRRKALKEGTDAPKEEPMEDKKPIIVDEEQPEEKKDDEKDEKDKKKKKKKKKKDEDDMDPMVRTRTPFGGIINDFKRRAPWYKSDFLDGLNTQCLSAAIFIYFACLSGAVAFGGLMGEKTDRLVGIPETIIVSAVAGGIFALFAGCPLIITGVTGPVLLFDEALYGFSFSNGLHFLYWRVWIGIWLIILALVVSAFQGSTLVKHFTKFTKDIFASLVALLFIFEAMRKLYLIFGEHPLQSLDTYCNVTLARRIAAWDAEEGNVTHLFDDDLLEEDEGQNPNKREPNTALLSAILMFGTFFIAYFLRIFRNGKYLGRTIRRALGDFGVPIGIVIMVLLDYAVHDTFTQKLDVPEGLDVTDPEQRGWFVLFVAFAKTGAEGADGLPVWAIFAAIVPAFLLYTLLFMETHICELIMMEKTQNKKGCGLHWDIVLLCGINCLGAFFGGPWICAATVRAVSHVSALTVMSTTHAPGESPKVVDVRDQRLTGLLVSTLLGVSVLLSPILKLVPFAVLFGVFLYMGVSAIAGIQYFDRVSLMFLPVKHHPQVSYVRRVKTWKMHMFTLLQTGGLVILWIVKSTKVALAFPFFVVAMIPYRLSLKFLFTPRELDAVSKKKTPFSSLTHKILFIARNASCVL